MYKKIDSLVNVSILFINIFKLYFIYKRI